MTGKIWKRIQCAICRGIGGVKRGKAGAMGLCSECDGRGYLDVIVTDDAVFNNVGRTMMHPTSERDDGPTMEMPRYQSHKKVWALKIEAIEDAGDAGYRLTPADHRYAKFTVDASIVSRYMPVPGDYYVVYDDGYKSISPAKAFEEGYTLIP